MSNVYEGLQDLVAQVPDVLQPLVVAAAGTIPYVEGEGSAALGVIAGLHPVVAGLAGFTGNVVSVLVVVLLGARAREKVLARRSAPAEAADPAAEPKPRSKGRRRLERWLVRFGVPGASLLAPLALPTQLTAATFVASGASRQWVMLWQVVAIAVWTAAVTLAATGMLSVLT